MQVATLVPYCLQPLHIVTIMALCDEVHRVLSSGSEIWLMLCFLLVQMNRHY